MITVVMLIPAVNGIIAKDFDTENEAFKEITDFQSELSDKLKDSAVSIICNKKTSENIIKFMKNLEPMDAELSNLLKVKI